MFENGCHVVSQPSLPSTRSHPCWEYWDCKLLYEFSSSFEFDASLVTLDLCLSNLYNLLTEKGSSIMQMGGSWFVPTSMRHNSKFLFLYLAPCRNDYIQGWSSYQSSVTQTLNMHIVVSLLSNSRLSRFGWNLEAIRIDLRNNYRCFCRFSWARFKNVPHSKSIV